MISGYAQSITNDKRRANIDAVLAKPFSPQRLQEALVKVFPGG
jgi:hypothetical protein